MFGFSSLILAKQMLWMSEYKSKSSNWYGEKQLLKKTDECTNSETSRKKNVKYDEKPTKSMVSFK